MIPIKDAQRLKNTKNECKVELLLNGTLRDPTLTPRENNRQPLFSELRLSAFVFGNITICFSNLNKKGMLAKERVVRISR